MRTPVHARDAVVNDNEPGSVQKSAPRESQIGVHIQLRWFAVENLLPARNISRGRQFGPRWHESDSAQHEDHLKHEQQEVHDRSPVSARTSALRSDTTMIGATSDLFLADCDQHHRSEFYAQ